MFKFYKMCSCIHLYATLLNHEGDEVVNQVPNTIISEHDEEWRVSDDELHQNGSDNNHSGSSYIEEEKRDNEINMDELSDYEEKHNLIACCYISTLVRSKFNEINYVSGEGRYLSI
jgi:hypothetical protein